MPTRPASQVWHAARSGDAEGIRQLCSPGGADPSGYKDPPTHSTALHEAVLGGHTRCASLLLSLGADASARDRSGNTPLHACAASAGAYGDVELTEALLEHGEAGAVAAANRAGVTPLHLAASRGKLALVRLLVEKGAPEERGGRG
jgi:ankyrin repeat protein